MEASISQKEHVNPIVAAFKRFSLSCQLSKQQAEFRTDGGCQVLAREFVTVVRINLQLGASASIYSKGAESRVPITEIIKGVTPGGLRASEMSPNTLSAYAIASLQGLSPRNCRAEKIAAALPAQSSPNFMTRSRNADNLNDAKYRPGGARTTNWCRYLRQVSLVDSQLNVVCEGLERVAGVFDGFKVMI